GSAEWWTMSRIVRSNYPLAHRTVVLPVEALGLDELGMLDGGSVEASPHLELDVGDYSASEDRRERWLYSPSFPPESRWRHLVSGATRSDPPSGMVPAERVVLTEEVDGNEDS